MAAFQSNPPDTADSPSSDGEHRMRRALEAAGCRFTRQRAAVYTYLECVDDHPTAEEVYRAVRQKLPRISLATVYNALEAMVSAHLATKLSYGDGSSRYDCRGEEHQAGKELSHVAGHDFI